MQAKFVSGLLLLVLVAVASTASLEHFKWPSLLEKLATINFYKQYYVYLQAIMNEGIPALGVPPIDPRNTSLTFEILQSYNPQFPNYTDMVVFIDALSFSHFSEFTIDVAELDLVEMLANLSVHQDLVDISSNDISATAINIDGRILKCNCSYFQGQVNDVTLSSVKQLEVNGTILQVKRFELNSDVSSLSAYGPIGCTGDVELHDYMNSLLLDTLATYEFFVIPIDLETLAKKITIFLNDIFALRNITYEDNSSTSSDHFYSNAGHELQSKLFEVDLEKSGESIRRSVTKAAYRKSAKNTKDTPIKIKWTY